MDIVTRSSKQTQEVAKDLAKEILATTGQNQALVFGLVGDLGSGKTTFIQGLAKGLGVKEAITSPTFVIMKQYDVKKRGIQHFFHIDCYRINQADLEELGLKEILADKKNVVALEWADRVKKSLPKTAVWLKFKYLDKDIREIKI